MRIHGISASAHQTYDWCAWKYFLQYGLGFEDYAGSAAFMGTIAHKVLEIPSRASIVKHNPNSKIWDAGYLWNICFNHYYNKEPAIAEQIEMDKLKKVCRGIHDLFDSDYSPVRDNTISAEVAFNIELTEPDFQIKSSTINAKDPLSPVKQEYLKLRGRIDRVDQIDENTIEIIDYKTGSRVCWDSKDRHKKTPEDLYEDIQPKMYHMAAKHLYPWATNCLVTFIYITDGGPVTVPFVDGDYDITKEILKRRFKTIQANEDPERNTGWKCKLCTFAKDGTCDMVWDEKNELGMDFIINKYRILHDRKY